MNPKNPIRHLLDVLFMMSVIWVGIGLSLDASYAIGYRVDDWSLMDGEMISLVASVISGTIAGVVAALFVQFYFIRYGVVKFLAALGTEVYLHIPVPDTIVAAGYSRPLIPRPSGDFPLLALGVGLFVFALVWFLGQKFFRPKAQQYIEANLQRIFQHTIDTFFIASIVFLGLNPPDFFSSYLYEFTKDCSLFGGENYCFIKSVSEALLVGVFSASFVHFYRVRHGFIKMSVPLSLMLLSGMSFLWHCSEKGYAFTTLAASVLVFVLLWFLFLDRFSLLVKAVVGTISVWVMWWYVQYTCDINQEAMYQYQVKKIEADKVMEKKVKNKDIDAPYRF